jgi:release factor glutamine methyltransferase
MSSIAQQLAHARAALAPVAGTNAALEARLLAAHAWGMTPEALVLYGNEVRDEAALRALVARRMKAEPVAQILGQKNFWKQPFFVTRDVLTPRADSETMIETLLRLRPDTQANLRMLDLGTGSGCLILSALGEYQNATGLALDASDAALVIAAKNAAALGLESRFSMQRSNWCEMAHGTFDVVLSNPPYIPTRDIDGLDMDVRGFEPHTALDGGADGLDCYREILGVADWSADQSYTPLRGLMAGSPSSLQERLNPGALVLFEVGIGQAEDVAALAVAQGFTLKEIVCDLAGIPRVVALEFNR